MIHIAADAQDAVAVGGDGEAQGLEARVSSKGTIDARCQRRQPRGTRVEDAKRTRNSKRRYSQKAPEGPTTCDEMREREYEVSAAALKRAPFDSPPLRRDAPASEIENGVVRPTCQWRLLLIREF